MSSNKDFIKGLFKRKGELIAEQRAVLASVEARADEQETAEDKKKLESLDKEIRDTSSRIDTFVALEENNQRDAEQRNKFEKMIVSENPQRREHDVEAEVRAFMRGSLPNATEWAPTSIEVKFLEQRDLTKGVAAAGGNLVPTGFIRTLMEHLVEAAAIRRTNARVFRTTSGENLQLPKTTSKSSAAIVGEGILIPESDPAFGQVTLGAFKYANIIEVSRELLEDNAVNLTDFLARDAGEAIGQANGAHLVTGTGTGQPQGIANAATAGKVGATGQTTSVTTEDLVDLFHSVVSGYRANAFWVMNDLTAAFIRKIKDSTGQFIWQPGLVAGQPDRIFGSPVITDPNVATMAANAFSIAFGDFSRYYSIRDVDGVRFERSDDFKFANDLTSFRVLFRTDARQVINGVDAAVKWYKNSAT